MATRTPEMRTPPMRLPWGRLLAVGAVTVLASTVVNVLLAQVLGSWLQVPAGFPPLHTPTVASFTVIGVAAAVLVFALLARRRPHPVAAFRVVAAVVLVISWTPDLLVLATHAFPDTTTSAVLSLMTLHAAAAVLAVILLGQFGLAPGDEGR